MKYAIAFLFCCINLLSLAQPVTNLKAHLSPNHYYEITFRGHISYKLDLKSKSPVAALQLESMGMKLPYESTEVTTIKTVTTTGSPDVKKQIPFETKYVRSNLQKEESDSRFSDSNEDYINELQGQKAKGIITAKGKIKIDSITDSRITQTDINRFDLINLFNLPGEPDKPMKSGDTYTVKEDEAKIIEFGPVVIKVQRKSVYKLIEIKDGKAYFDISSQLSGSFMGNKEKGNAKGGGNGKMVFDIQKSMPIEYSNNINTIITIPVTPEDSIEITYTSLANNTVKIN